MRAPTRRTIAVTVAALLALASCTSEATPDSAADTAEAPTSTLSAADVAVATTEVSTDDASSSGVDLAAFYDGALTAEPVTTDCTLADGTETQCLQLTIAGFPANRDAIGPWCPATTSDGAAGIWFDGDDVYDIDGQFITDLADIYDDPTWKLYDEDGNVLSTDTSEKFNDLVTGGPQADPDAGPVNLCVYGEIEWADGGGPIAATVEIPVTPIRADTPEHHVEPPRRHPRRRPHREQRPDRPHPGQLHHRRLRSLRRSRQPAGGLPHACHHGVLGLHRRGGCW